MTLAHRDRHIDSRLLDPWSLAHFAAALGLALVVPPFWALLAMFLWEPLELLFLNPLLARWHIDFANEDLRNSLSDLVFDAAGVLAAAHLVRPVWDPFAGILG